jgi:translocation and assembly module TamB
MALGVLGFFVLVIAVAAVWIVIWVQSETGQTWLAKVVSRAVSSEVQQVHLEKLLVSPRGIIRLQSFQIKDADGAWLHGENLEIRLDVYELLKKKLLIEDARLQSIAMTRVPQGSPPDEEDRPFRLVVPPLPQIEVQHFNVDRAVIDSAVIGETQVFKLKAYADLGGSTSLATVEVDRLEGADGLVKLRAELDAATQDLDLNLLVEEAPGGMAPKLLGLEASGFKAELTGKGPIDRLKGHVNAAFTQAGALDADFMVQQAEDITVDLHGTSSISPSLAPERFRPLLQEPTQFGLRFVSGDSGMAVENLEIKATQARLAVSAQAGPEFERVVGDFSLEILKALPPDMLNGLILETGSKLTGTLTEAEGTHTLAISAVVPKADFKDMSVSAAHLTAQLTNNGGVKEPLAGLKGLGELRVSELRLSKDQPSFQDIQTRFSADMPDLSRVNIQSLEIQTPWMQSKVNGHVTLDDFLAGLAAEIRIPDIGRTPFKTVLTGALQLTSRVTGSLMTPDLSITADGDLSGLSGLPVAVGKLTGDRLAISAKIGLQQSQLQFQDVAITGLSRLTADGKMDIDKQVAEADFRVSLPENLEFPFASLLKISGPTSIQGSLSGPLSGFDLRVQAEAGKLESGGYILAKPRARVQMSGVPAKIKGHAELESDTTGGAVAAFGDFQLNGTDIQLSGFQVKAPGAEISAKAVINRRTGLANGQADFSIKDLGLIGAFTGLKLAGSTKGTVGLKAREATQYVDIDLEASKLAINEIRSDRLSVKAENVALTGEPSGRARVNATGLQASDLRFDKIRLNLENSTEGARVAGDAEGKWKRALNVSFDALVGKTGGTSRLTLNRLSGKIGKNRFQQSRALQITYSSRELTVRDLALGIGPGRITGFGSLTGTEVESNLSITNLPLETAMFFIDTGLVGIIDGRVQLNGPAKGPTGRADLELKGVRPAGPDYASVSPLVIALNLNLAKSLITGKADIAGLDEKPGRAEFSLPLRFSIKPFNATVPKGGNLSAKASASVDLSLLPVLLSLDNQSLTGSAQADLRVAGKINNPQITGQILVADGRYENVRIGALFDRINAQIKASGSKLEITQATATDGEGGKIQAQGKIDMNPESQYPYQLMLNFQGAKLIRLDLLNARCWGDIDLKGNTAGADLGGSIKMDPIVLNIPNKSGPDVPNLEIKEINVPAGTEAPAPKKTDGFRLNLDIGLEMPGRAHVRGRGLDTEWQGKLKVQGTSVKPQVKGRLDLVRGRFDFLGRTFRLTEGTLTFSGAYPPLPFINVTGEVTAGDIAALVNITGPATSPKLELSSTPSLPKDEILSRVLFGRNLNTISAIQALRLAQAANQLAGGGGPDLDIMGKARDTLQLDDIDIGQTDEGAGTVGVGKYINEDIYVRAEKDLTPGDGKVTVEIEIGPSFSLETQTGGSSAGKFGVNWKKDY